MNGKQENGMPGLPRTASSFSRSILARLSRLRSLLHVVYIVIIGALLIAHIVRLNPRIAAHIWSPTHIKPTEFHVLIPATGPSRQLCETLLTAAILDYPTPTLLNWGKTFDDPNLVAGGAQLANIYAVEEWAMRLRSEQREDLVLLLNDHDAWFQLRPHVLIERYKDSVKASNKWSKARLERAYAEERLGDHTIFAATKKCEPNLEGDIGCYPAPQSPLSEDLYGENTDTSNGHNQYSSYRPRFLSASVFMGPISDVRQITKRAYKMKDEEEHNGGGSDSFIYNTIFGQQEFQRQVFRARHLSWIGRLKRFLRACIGIHETSILDPTPFHEPMEHFETRSFDYGIGLDYSSTFVHDVANSEWDLRSITYADKKEHVDVNELDCTPHLTTLPHDISSTYITFPGIQPESLHRKAWADLPLYTNMCTGKIPVIIHNAADAAKRDLLWRNFWMQPIAEELFETLQTYASFQTPEDNLTDIGLNLGDALTDTGEKLKWDSLCSSYRDEIFAR